MTAWGDEIWSQRRGCHGRRYRQAGRVPGPVHRRPGAPHGQCGDQAPARLCQALAAGPVTVGELAARTGTSPRYIAGWLCGQRRQVEYDPATGAFSMTGEQAFALASPDGGVYLPGAFLLALGALNAGQRITEAFRTGAGLGWHEHDEDVFVGCELFFRPGYAANLVPSRIRAVRGCAYSGLGL